jgi:Carboxypeptidase regulatory-like domain
VIKRNSISILLLFLSFLAHSALAQTASITGTIKDSSGGLVPQAQITAKNKATNASRSALTDESGTYRITSLVPGIYDVLIAKQGFKTVEYSKVELTVDQVQNLDARLVPSSMPNRGPGRGFSVRGKIE